MQSDREQLRHSINHPHGLVFDTPESKDAKIPFGFIFGIRAGQDIDCIVGGFNLPLDTMIDILQYLPIVEILKARKISKYFNYAASIYLSKLNDAFFHIGVLSDCYVFSNFYKKCKLENGVFSKSENRVFFKPEKTTNFEKEILIDFSNICFDTSQDESFVEFLIENSKANPIEDVPMPTTDNKKRKDLNSVNSVNSVNSRDGKNIFSQNLKNQTSNSIISYVRKGHLSKYCRENHAHLCHDCAAKYKQNICKHIHCPAEYHRACTGDINCEYRCYRCDHTDNTDQTEPLTAAITEDNSLKSNENSPVNSKNSADFPDNRKLQRHGSQTQIDPSGQQVPKNQVQFANYAGNNFASNTVNNATNYSKNAVAVTGSGETGSASRSRHAQGGSSFNLHSVHSMHSIHSMHSAHILHGEDFEPEYDYRVLPLINTEDRMEFGYCMIDRMPRDIVKCDRHDCRRDILISFRPNLSVQYLENHLLVRRRILGEEIYRENAVSCELASGHESANELTVPDIIKNYEKNNGCITWYDLGIIQRLIKSLNNQVELDYWQQEICRNYQEFKISSMDSVEFAFLEHPSIFSEELHPIQCLHDSGHCEESHDEDWQCAFVGGDTYRNN